MLGRAIGFSCAGKGFQATHSGGGSGNAAAFADR
jgi:hypothetical protein